MADRSEVVRLMQETAAAAQAEYQAGGETAKYRMLKSKLDEIVRLHTRWLVAEQNERRGIAPDELVAKLQRLAREVALARMKPSIADVAGVKAAFTETRQALARRTEQQRAVESAPGFFGRLLGGLQQAGVVAALLGAAALWFLLKPRAS